MKNFVANLRWRGMIHDIVPGIEEHLSNSMVTGYIGFEPSASSLHLGNLVTLMLLKHFQEAGHKPIVVVGGATAMVGDPSWKAQERLFLPEEIIRHNEDCISQQLKKFLDFDTGKNKAVVLNNFDWLRDISFLSFLRDVGKHIPIGYMMAKDSVKRRIETGISYTEFAYQLLQGFDFYYLYLNKGVTLQMGGADQWGNLTTGIELIRKKAHAQAFAITAPLFTRSDGIKFGKTTAGANVWLDASKTSPYELYQFLLNCTDYEVEKLIKVFACCSKEEIEALIVAHQAKPETRLLQQTVAKMVTTMVHSEEACSKAIVSSHILFSNVYSMHELYALSEDDLLTVCATIPKIHITQATLNTVDSIISLLSVTTEGVIMTSKSEAKRMIASHGIMINKVLITDPYQKPDFILLHSRYLLVQKGKKNYYLMVVQ
ncbi:tyrosine--tRNA ligase [Candidatus Cardinium hertigii]|uniref:Tyrosine--tRNA ligase n=1 Tax=Candidatus Cardinium hertigii TaxID=247481 RepID=A0A3N2QC71_9BACT|nr:tyrosine--tRNA ligase [Candidatus Cardinium hertigii]ROT47390.1 tyrosine--tRNA ligase [Candidatus Cardinium hertigii]